MPQMPHITPPSGSARRHHGPQGAEAGARGALRGMRKKGREAGLVRLGEQLRVADEHEGQRRSAVLRMARALVRLPVSCPALH